YPDLEESIWSDGFWSEGYFVGTVGQRELREVIKYVKNQNKD
ncbi:IS200/IS605 family transposase, partial [Candidatus Beckwithbacteria bacterium]|nr:IS200/IS605 family transposase [Candidatus Beckwithbacteria bacterium]